MKQASKTILPAMFFGLIIFLNGCIPVNKKYIGEYSCSCTYTKWQMNYPYSVDTTYQKVISVKAGTSDNTIFIGNVEWVVDEEGHVGNGDMYTPFSISFRSDSIFTYASCCGGLGGGNYTRCKGKKN